MTYRAAAFPSPPQARTPGCHCRVSSPSWAPLSDWCLDASVLSTDAQALRRTAPHRRPLPGQLKFLAGLAALPSVDLEDRDVAVGVVADVEVLAVGAEDDALRQAAHLDLAHLGDLPALDLEHGEAAVAFGVEPHVLGHAGAAQQDGHRHVALRADRKAFGRVADHHAIDHPGRLRLEIDDA